MPYTLTVPSPVSITAAYAFFPIQEEMLLTLQSELKTFGMKHEMRGLVLLAQEGLNSTVCGSPEAIEAWKEKLRTLDPSIVFKDSEAQTMVFRRWSVKIKREIVTIKKPGIAPAGHHRHVTPEEWHAMMARGDAVIVDTRNDYEVAIGKFRGAMNPNIKHFSEFPRFVEESGIPKDAAVMMYCTGGIRCEKAIYAMEERGYTNVVQLQGGILAYLEKFRGGSFEGECFVFDKRVAVDGQLRPSSQYSLCYCCGDPIRNGTLCEKKITSTALPCTAGGT